MRKFWKTWKEEFFIGLGILLLALFLRLYNLAVLPIFGDEAIYIRWAQVMRAEPTLRFLPLTDGKQPLFMWSIIPLTKVFSDPLIAGRVVSVITGLGTLIGVFVLTYILFRSKKNSFLAILIYAISPFSVFFDRMALADSMLAFFGIWTLIFVIITVKKVRLDSAMLAGFSLGGAFLTKSPAIFFAVLIPAALILHKWPKKLKEKFNRTSVFVFLFTFTYVIALGMYNILRLGPNFHMLGIRNKDYVYPLSRVLTSPFDPLFPFLDRILEYLWLIGPSTLVLLFIAGVYIGLKEKRKETLVLLSWGILPIFAVSEFSKVMTARYVYFSVPYLFILASLSLGAKLIHPPGGLKLHLGTLIRIVFIVFVVHAFILDYQLLTNPQRANLPRSERSGYLEEWTAGTGIEEVAEYIQREHNENPEAQIVIGTEGFFGTLPDGLQIYLNDYKNVVVKGVGVTITDVHPSLLDSKKAGNKTYLVVNNSRFKGDSNKLGLELLASYPKATRVDGSRESLLFFEVSEKAVEQ